MRSSYSSKGKEHVNSGILVSVMEEEEQVKMQISVQEDEMMHSRMRNTLASTTSLQVSSACENKSLDSLAVHQVNNDYGSKQLSLVPYNATI